MLRIEDLVMQYKTGDVALKHVNLEVPRGQVMALIGPSGAGKSTLIRCVNRLVQPAPTALLKSEFGLVKDVDYKTVFSGKHDNSVLGIANKDYEVATIANSVMNRMFDRKVVDRSQITTIYKSATFPTTGYGHVYNLDPTVAAKVKQAFFTFKWEGSDLQKEFKKEGRFVSIDHKSDWGVIRQIDAANGIEYACK